MAARRQSGCRDDFDDCVSFPSPPCFAPHYYGDPDARIRLLIPSFSIRSTSAAQRVQIRRVRKMKGRQESIRWVVLRVNRYVLD